MERDFGNMDREKNSMPNIIITGGLGFIGSHLVKRLINSGHSPDAIHVIDTQRNSASLFMTQGY